MYEELIMNLRSVKDTWQTQEEEWMLQAADAIEKLMALTSADVKPVVRGEWIWEEASWGYRCSACQIMFDYDKTYQMFDHGFANFCPNCGAEMRKEEKQNE